MGNRFASGKWAIAQCDRCDGRYKLKELRREVIKGKNYELLVCKECWDPDQPQLQDVVIADELTEFNIADPATAWWMPWGESHDTELLYGRTPLTELSTAHTPLTIRTKDHLHVEIHEAALVDFAGMYLQRSDEQHLRAHLVPASEGWAARRAAPGCANCRAARLILAALSRARSTSWKSRSPVNSESSSTYAAPAVANACALWS